MSSQGVEFSSPQMADDARGLFFIGVSMALKSLMLARSQGKLAEQWNQYAEDTAGFSEDCHVTIAKHRREGYSHSVSGMFMFSE